MFVINLKSFFGLARKAAGSLKSPLLGLFSISHLSAGCVRWRRPPRIVRGRSGESNSKIWKPILGHLFAAPDSRGMGRGECRNHNRTVCAGTHFQCSAELAQSFAHPTNAHAASSR